jgi:hypothetical protein
MRKLIQQKEAAQLAMNILCDVTKKHCSMCKCSDNPLLFDPAFAEQYIKERQSWLIYTITNQLCYLYILL